MKSPQIHPFSDLNWPWLRSWASPASLVSRPPAGTATGLASAAPGSTVPGPSAAYRPLRTTTSIATHCRRPSLASSLVSRRKDTIRSIASIVLWSLAMWGWRRQQPPWLRMTSHGLCVAGAWGGNGASRIIRIEGLLHENNDKFDDEKPIVYKFYIVFLKITSFILFNTEEFVMHTM